MLPFPNNKQMFVLFRGRYWRATSSATLRLRLARFRRGQDFLEEAAALFGGATEVFAGVEEGEGDDGDEGEASEAPISEPVCGSLFGRAGQWLLVGGRRGNIRAVEPESQAEEDQHEASRTDAPLATGDQLGRAPPSTDLNDGEYHGTDH